MYVCVCVVCGVVWCVSGVYVCVVCMYVGCVYVSGVGAVCLWCVCVCVVCVYASAEGWGKQIAEIGKYLLEDCPQEGNYSPENVVTYLWRRLPGGR